MRSCGLSLDIGVRTFMYGGMKIPPLEKNDHIEITIKRNLLIEDVSVLVQSESILWGNRDTARMV